MGVTMDKVESSKSDGMGNPCQDGVTQRVNLELAKYAA